MYATVAPIAAGHDETRIIAPRGASRSETGPLTIVQKCSIVGHERDRIRQARQTLRPEARPALPFDPGVGKGSHGRLHVGGRFTTVPRKELGKGLLAAMLKDLGIDGEAF